MRDFRTTPEPGVSTGSQPRHAAMGKESRWSPWKIISYFAILNLSIGLGAPLIGLAVIPINDLLMARLGLSQMRVAIFVSIASAPAYVGFLLGFLRDRWRPPIWGDRAYLLVGGMMALGAYLWLGYAASASKIDYYSLLCGDLIAAFAYTIIGAAAKGLMTSVAQAHLMTGRLSVVFGFGFFVPLVPLVLLGGWLVTNVSPQGMFMIAGCATAVIVAQAFWRLDGVIAPGRGDLEVDHAESGLAAIKRLAAHRPIWPAALIWFLWSFTPGWGTPMFYHLTRTEKISTQFFPTYNALEWGFFLPTILLYGLVCRRTSLARLLWWGTLVAILQGPIMFLANSESSAIAVAIGFGLLGGFATAAYMDLIMRSCPLGLEGTGMMLSAAAFAIATNSENLLSDWIYARGGFPLAIIVTTLTTTLIVPILWWVPSSVTASREGERAVLVPKAASGK